MHTYLYGNIPFGYFSHIEPNCRNHIFCELPRLEYKTKIILIIKQLIHTRKVLTCKVKMLFYNTVKYNINFQQEHWPALQLLHCHIKEDCSFQSL